MSKTSRTVTYAIEPVDLTDRGIYAVTSRNLLVGAWSARIGGFIGVREKFTSRYLFTEYEYDLQGPPYGTARAYKLLGTVPDGIDLDETSTALFDLLDPLDQELATTATERPYVSLRPGMEYRLPVEAGIRWAESRLAAARPHTGKVKHLRDVRRYHLKRLAV